MCDWSQIEHVFLDMDGTLLDLHFDNYFWLEHLPQRYADIHGGDPKAVRDQLHQRFEAIRGTLDWYCLEYWQRALEVDIVALKREVSNRIQLRPEAGAFMDQLRQRDVQVALVSNAHRWSINLKIDTVLPAHYFDVIYSSHDFGFPKEEQAFWHALKGAYDFDPQHTLFIDDNEQVLESAEQFGIAHLRSIRMPDSKGSPQPPGKFPQIDRFGALFD